MKVTFYCDSGANIHSCRKQVVDIEAEFGITDEDWTSMDENERYELVELWAWEKLNMGYTE